MTKQIKKNFVWNFVGSTLNSTTSLFFLIIVTRINGIKEAGIFTFAFSTACLLQVIGTYYGRAYQVTEMKDEFTDNDFLYSRFFSCGAMLLFAVLFSLIKEYALYKILVIILLVFYKIIEAFSESVYAIIQKNNDLYKVGISLFLKGLLGLFIFFALDLIFSNLIISIIGLIFINLFMFVFYDIKNVKMYNYVKSDFDLWKIKSIFKNGFYTFVFTFLTQYVINAPRYAIDNNLGEKYQTIFGIIIMPATLFILCGQFMIHPFLVTLTNDLKEKNYAAFSKLVFKIVFYVLIIGIFVTIVAYFIGIPFLELVYGISLKKYLKSLVIIIIGATMFGMSYIISNALITMRKTMIQSIIFTIGSIFVYFVSNKLVFIKQIEGASISYFLVMSLILVMYIVVFSLEIIKYSKKEVKKNEK